MGFAYYLTDLPYFARSPRSVIKQQTSVTNYYYNNADCSGDAAHVTYGPGECTAAACSNGMKTVCGALIADVTLGAQTYVQTQYFGTTDCIAPSYASDYLLAMAHVDKMQWQLRVHTHSSIMVVVVTSLLSILYHLAVL